MSETNATPKVTPKPGPKIERIARLRWIPLNRMVVSDKAQRELKQYRVDHLVAHFDLEQIGTPVVNERHGRFFIIDGQHRHAALVEKFGETGQVQCWTYAGLNEEQEAEKFLQLNDTLTVAAFDKYQVSVEAGRAVEADIDRIVRACGLAVSRQKGEGAIGAVGTLRRVYTRGGAGVLARTLRMIDASWGSAGFEASVIDGLGLLCGRYNGELQDELAIVKFKNMRGGVSGLQGKARLIKERTGQPFAQCVAAAAVEIINSGKGGKKLQSWWKAEAA
jgi:hypothetical protein